MVGFVIASHGVFCEGLKSSTEMLSREKHIIIVVGANLPMLLTLTLGRNEDSTLEELAAMAESEAKESIGTICYNRK